MAGCAIDLYWIPVGAGTSRFQRASLAAWEAFEAFRARRPRATLFHSALKLAEHDGSTHTLELMPAFVRQPVQPLVTGPVGLRGADRLTLFRYQLVCLPAERLPDEEWAEEPIRLAEGCESVRAVMAAASDVPRYVWGRRVRGTKEMWTSDSAISWTLAMAGLDTSRAGPPVGGRAPGWRAGIAVAGRQRRTRQAPL